MRLLIPVILIVLVAFYYLSYYPPVFLKGRTQAALDAFAASVELKDRDSVSEALHQLLTDDAEIKLEMTFFSFGTAGANPAIIQDFDKSELILFIDNVLYPLTDYGYKAKLADFVLSAGQKTAQVRFISEQWARDVMSMGGLPMSMHYDSVAHCDGEVVFIKEHKAQLKKVHCKISLRSTAKETR